MKETLSRFPIGSSPLKYLLAKLFDITTASGRASAVAASPFASLKENIFKKSFCTYRPFSLSKVLPTVNSGSSSQSI
jgi:hypothetical protein